MADLHGFMLPRSPEGRASLIPAPPWHYSGDVLTLEYRAASGAVGRWLPSPLAPADDEPDAVAVIFADWQSCSDGGDELLDPVRSQYKEAFVVVRCRFEGETYSRCVLIWVDKDFALARGWYQGYPKKIGSIWMTRPITVGRAGPRLEPGGVIGATLAANDRRLIDARFTIEGQSETGGFVNALPMLHSRLMPAIDPTAGDVLDELVTMRSQDVELGPCWRGSFELTLHDEAVEELISLAPVEPIAGYWRQVGVTFAGGEILA
ncbi:MAG: acetoacetate decarboxylase family protein [Actinomycetota bacterium]|nr:acetoacetate decarboxylase family protein [Actinomycetota bacterium]